MALLFYRATGHDVAVVSTPGPYLLLKSLSISLLVFSDFPGWHRVAVMYGSQTGNAQSIAERVHESCKGRGLKSTLLICDGWKKVMLYCLISLDYLALVGIF